MNPKPKLVEEQPAETDFIDDIAELLPAEQRPLWYRDMAHLRRLPADDEMLRIARATDQRITNEKTRHVTEFFNSLKSFWKVRNA